jgi:hypothetical protein
MKMDLMEACKLGHLERINELLDCGADIHVGDDEPLRVSAWCERVEVVRLLLDCGADIHVRDDEPLRLSASKGHLEVVRLLLDCGADIHVRDDEPLRFSAWCGRVEVVRLLLDCGADIHANNDEALRISAQYGHVEVVRLLLDRGALLLERYMISTSCMNLVRIYIHDDSLFVKQCRVFGVLRRHVHSLEELCRKDILVYTRCLPDKIEKIEKIDFELCVKTLKSMT